MLEPKQADNSLPRSTAQTQEQEQDRDPLTLGLPSFFDDIDSPDDDVALRAQRQSWLRRRWIFAVAGLLVVALVAGGILAAARSRAQPIAYQTQDVVQGNLLLSVSATGPVQVSTYGANFATNGTVSAIFVKIGQQVKSGQAL